MEVRMGDWFIFPESAAAVFSADPDSLWSQMIQTTKVDIAGARRQMSGEGKKTNSLAHQRHYKGRRLQEIADTRSHVT